MDAREDIPVSPVALERPVRRSWLLAAFPLALAAMAYCAIRPRTITETFLVEQDLPALAASVAFIALCFCAPLYRRMSGLDALAARAPRHGLAVTIALAIGAGALALVGGETVYQRYGPSADEFWAMFDARVFEHGEFLARVPDPWRTFVPAMQPMWRMEVAGDTHWASLYLPMNAAIRALFGLLGGEALAGAAWSALALLLLYAIARRLWPERRDAALVAVLLLASSAQFLVTAMTPYAMPAHLALNLLWLYLLMLDRRWSHALAAGVAFVATGLHQIVFHPLFAAPFVAQLWLLRRWRPALFHTLAYALIGLFWIAYWGLLLDAQGLAAKAQTGVGAAYFLKRVLELLQAANLNSAGLMAENLTRFVAWQNPLAVSLGLVAVPAAVRRWREPFLPLLAGLVATIAVVWILQPLQGHGWGYRYLHGLLGNLCLLAALAWVRLAPEAAGTGRREAWGLLAGAMALSLAVLLPMRLHQVASFVRPFATAYRTIQAADADVVIVDGARLWYGVDLVRNDPYLASGPKIMSIDALTPHGVGVLCSRYKVRLFDSQDGLSLGMKPSLNPRGKRAAADRAVMRELGCERHVVEAPPPRA